MKKLVYLFYGFGAEYTLHPLYTELEKGGKECIEVDALNVSDSRKAINKLKGTDIVFVTSAHFLMDQKNFTDFYPTKNKFHGVLEIIALLKPIKTVYVPHDLTQPLIDYETEYLNQIDLFLTPCEPYTSIYSQYCPVDEVGWIKYRKPSDQITRKLETQKTNKAIWFLSDFVLHEKMGPEKSYEMLSPVLKQKVSIKFPVWFKTREFEKYFSQQGIMVYPAETNTIELIETYNTIITNGLSSIIAESYFMGKTTVNIAQGSHYGDMLPVITDSFPDVIFIDTIGEFRLADIPKKERKRTLKSFDMEKAIALITSS